MHPGGPFWKNKDTGAWSIPKGEYSEDEEPLTVARREFKEETGAEINGTFQPLGTITQKGGKTVTAWAAEGTIDADKIVSNTLEIEWPPKSGKIITIPEVDKAAWFSLQEAELKINSGQARLLHRLVEIIGNKK